ncbi:hypothetical protein [Virgibacillus salinus]|uniref:Uncharacterized protein n=1 Tax=Virgibacillus salinus TaxID=553311 RepID=A0A1H0XTG0_9BACI|nr:hypothetical protein [Virgibacillus salinus]SDQ06173.1 hypothetical protein SAMN05216231_0189 [Virgibacillus salinus]
MKKRIYRTRYIIGMIGCLLLIISGLYNIITYGLSFGFVILSLGGCIGFIGGIYEASRRKKNFN